MRWSAGIRGCRALNSARGSAEPQIKLQPLLISK
jgi:hypothetical protein